MNYKQMRRVLQANKTKSGSSEKQDVCWRVDTSVSGMQHRGRDWESQKMRIKRLAGARECE